MRDRAQIFKAVALFLKRIARVAFALYIYLVRVNFVRLLTAGRVDELAVTITQEPVQSASTFSTPGSSGE